MDLYLIKLDLRKTISGWENGGVRFHIWNSGNTAVQSYCSHVSKKYQSTRDSPRGKQSGECTRKTLKKRRKNPLNDGRGIEVIVDHL